MDFPNWLIRSFGIAAFLQIPHLFFPTSPPAFRLDMGGGPAASGPGIGANRPQGECCTLPFRGVAFSAFGGILFGYDTGVISGIKEMGPWLKQFGYAVPINDKSPFGYAISSETESLVVSILSAGSGVVLACLIFSVGIAMQTAATGVPLFVVGRVFAGIGSECGSVVAVVSTYQWAITIGMLLAGIINNATKDYAGRGRIEDATRALGRITGLPSSDTIVQAEVEDIRMNLDAEQSPFRTLTGIFIQAMQQLSGINFIFYYERRLQTGWNLKPILITIATNIVSVVMTLPGMYGVERFGRRTLLLFGAAAMCFCEFVVAIVGVTVSDSNMAGQKVLIAFGCFAATWGPITWVVTGEIFPLQIRAKAMSLSVAGNWLWNFGIGYATPYLVNTGPGNAGLEVKVFFIWGGCCALAYAFTWSVWPETKGLSLEQIDTLYQTVYPWQSSAYVVNSLPRARNQLETPQSSSGRSSIKEKPDIVATEHV
ncbi:AmMst-1 [Coprinopsis sp. MPI-PUGE-AT-0042]|nr:AmMst-1 [Coprinopsis sp. MPI-PUGE-AT-0042]